MGRNGKTPAQVHDQITVTDDSTFVQTWLSHFAKQVTAVLASDRRVQLKDDEEAGVFIPEDTWDNVNNRITKYLRIQLICIQRKSPLRYPLPKPLYNLLAPIAVRNLMNDKVHVQIFLNSTFWSDIDLTELEDARGTVLAIFGQNGYFATQLGMAFYTGTNYLDNGDSGRPKRIKLKLIRNTNRQGTASEMKDMSFSLDNIPVRAGSVTIGGNTQFFHGEHNKMQKEVLIGLAALLPPISNTVADRIRTLMDSEVSPLFPSMDEREVAARACDVFVHGMKDSNMAVAGMIGLDEHPSVCEDASLAVLEALFTVPSNEANGANVIPVDPGAYGLVHLIGMAAMRPHVFFTNAVFTRSNQMTSNELRNNIWKFINMCAQHLASSSVPLSMSESLRAHQTAYMRKGTMSFAGTTQVMSFMREAGTNPVPPKTAPRDEVLQHSLMRLMNILDPSMSGNSDDLDIGLMGIQQLSQYLQQMSRKFGTYMHFAPVASVDSHKTPISPRYFIECRGPGADPGINGSDTNQQSGSGFKTYPMRDAGTGVLHVSETWLIEYLESLPKEPPITGTSTPGLIGHNIQADYLLFSYTEQEHMDFMTQVRDAAGDPTNTALYQRAKMSINGLIERSLSSAQPGIVSNFVSALMDRLHGQAILLTKCMRSPLMYYGNNSAELQLQIHGFHKLGGDGTDRRGEIAHSNLKNSRTGEAEIDEQRVLQILAPHGGWGFRDIIKKITGGIGSVIKLGTKILGGPIGKALVGPALDAAEGLLGVGGGNPLGGLFGRVRASVA